nr:putative endosialidase [uncultured Mediterranean phage uvMED]
MSETIQFKRTSVLQKRPTAAQLALGEPAVVLHQSSFGVFLEDANGDIRKVGPIHVGSSAPNASAAGSAGYSVGEGWLDTTTNALKIWDGIQWLSISGGGGGGSSSGASYLEDFGFETGSVDYGLVTQSATSSEDWGSSLSLLSN